MPVELADYDIATVLTDIAGKYNQVARYNATTVTETALEDLRLGIDYNLVQCYNNGTKLFDHPCTPGVQGWSAATFPGRNYSKGMMFT